MQIVEGLLRAGPVLGSGDTMNKIKSLLSWRLFSRGRRRQTINKYKITVITFKIIVQMVLLKYF